MRVLIACEESQTVCKAFRERGHEAYSIKKICLENPVGLANTRWRKPSQIIHPYYFGDGEMKETCLWLKGLTRINGLHHIDRHRDKPKPTPGKSRIGSDGKMKKLKSKTFPGIARAMAEQWG